jgi:lipid II:glycine glycyltransferase (peptidoglycan interpeptide bridge formation enzyme)
LEAPAELPNFISYLQERCRQSRWRYIEIRPRKIPGVLEENRVQREKPNQDFGYAPNLATHQNYNFHQIDLRADLQTLFNNFHKNCIQRKIQRAERENLRYEAGRSNSNLRNFYQLLLLTRRRHRIPPQPMAWFWNLRDSFGKRLTIRIASKDGRPIASILTLVHKNTVFYKYGCSDSAFHNVGSMPMLFWNAIQEEKCRGVQQFDLGRSDLENPGLSAFKEHLGGECSRLTYFRLGSRGPIMPSGQSSMWLMREIFAHMPGVVAQMAGNMLYRHMG